MERTRCPSGRWFPTMDSCSAACTMIHCCDLPSGRCNRIQQLSCPLPLTFGDPYAAECRDSCATGFCCVVNRRTSRLSVVESCTQRSWSACRAAAVANADARWGWYFGNVPGQNACKNYCGVGRPVGVTGAQNDGGAPGPASRGTTAFGRVINAISSWFVKLFR